MTLAAGTAQGSATITSADGLKSVVASAYGYDSDTAYRHIGISSMNGITDKGETVSIADFNTILSYAESHHIARFTFWSVNRDRQCSGANNGASSCSGISQSPYDFTKIIAKYHG